MTLVWAIRKVGGSQDNTSIIFLNIRMLPPCKATVQTNQLSFQHYKITQFSVSQTITLVQKNRARRQCVEGQGWA